MTRLAFVCVLALSVRAELPAQEARVGPAKGTIIAVGGGTGPDLLARFVDAAGGPDALILDVPTASLTSAASPFGLANDRAASVDVREKWRAAGARNVQVLHTSDRMVAD